MSSSMTPFTDVESNGNKSRSPSSKPKKEKHLIAAVVILAIVLVAFIIAVIILALKTSKHTSSDEVCATEGCLTTALDLVQAMNTSVDPCDDFYQYACGSWPNVYSGPAPHKMGSTAVTNFIDIHDYLVGAMIDENVPDSVKGVSAAYIKCSDYDDLTDEDELWLLQVLQDVGGWPMTDRSWDESRYHWERNLAQAYHVLGISTPFVINVDLDIFNTKRFIIHIHQHSPGEITPFNKEQILSIAKRIGNREDDPTLEKEYEKLEEFDQMLRKMSRNPSELQDDPHETKVLTIADLSRTIHWINWSEFLRTIFGPYLSTTIHQSEPVLLIGINYISKVLEAAFQGEVTTRTLANYIAASFIRSLLAVNVKVAPQSLHQPTKDLIGNTANVHMPEKFSESCQSFLSTKVPHAVDFLNYKHRKTGMVDREMIDYYFSAMKDMITEAKWLDEKTRTAANEKLAAIRLFIGFPEIAKDVKLLEKYLAEFPVVTDNALKNQLLIERFHFKKQVEWLRKPVNKDMWPAIEGTHGSQLNAFYVPEYNGIVIPADIQKLPMFSPQRPKFWNFGAFGWVIGHEVTHAFDTSGSKRDKSGNVRDWWMPKAKEEFNSRAKCLIEQYNKIPYGYQNHYVNGTLTIGENVADNGGLRQAYIAYKKWEKEHGKEKAIPGFEKFSIDQMFFLSVAQSYCSISTTPKEIYDTFGTDVHSPTNFRFNPAAANFDEFGKAFKCKTGTRMNPAKKCVIW